MPNSRPTRWQEARRDWPGFQWRDLIPGAIGLGIAIFVLEESKFPGSTVAEVGIVGACAIAAGVLYAVAQLVWAWLQAPMRLLTEDVIAIRERVEQLQPQSAALPAKQRVNVRLKLIELQQEGESITRSRTTMTAVYAEEWSQAVFEFLSEHLPGADAERFLAAGTGNPVTRLVDRLGVLNEVIQMTPHDD